MQVIYVCGSPCATTHYAGLCAQVNWETLWLPWQQRSLREMLILPVILFFLLFPIGLFSGVLPPSSAAQAAVL